MLSPVVLSEWIPHSILLPRLSIVRPNCRQAQLSLPHEVPLDRGSRCFSLDHSGRSACRLWVQADKKQGPAADAAWWLILPMKDADDDSMLIMTSFCQLQCGRQSSM